MSERRRKGILVAAIIWIAILGVLAVGYKYLIHPLLQRELAETTGSPSRYKQTVRLALDAFSGYAVLRSDAMHKMLGQRAIRLKIEDDQADYIARIKALRDGDTDMAVFTVDALLTAGAAIDDFPATIVLVIDETTGADAIVGFRDSLPNLQALDDPEARIVATPSSPSEFLARTVIATLSLPSLPKKWLIKADGAADVYKQLKAAASRPPKHAYVLWEPFVSKALKEKGTHVLLDSAKMKGYIVDVLVARRDYLKEHVETVMAVVDAYLRTEFSHSQRKDGLVDLVMQDAKVAGEPLSRDEARKLVRGIRWKNTLENYAHFGVDGAGGKPGQVEHLEDVVNKIADVLVRTGALKRNPVEGREHTLFFRQILAGLHAKNFHPGKQVDILEGIGPGTADLQAARTAAALPALAESEWKRLVPVGAMRVDPITFRRGTAELSDFSKSELNSLAKRFNSWPSYYLRLEGHARAEGDAQANRELARARARATIEHMVAQGVARHRIQTVVADPAATGSHDRSETSFVLLQKPY